MPYRPDLKYIDRELKGTLTLEIEIDTGRENGVQEPRVLNQIEEVSHNIARAERDDILIGKVFSVTDILKEIHQALNEGQETFYTIPQQRDVIFQEFLLFENSGADDLRRIVDSPFKKTRLTIKTSWADAIMYKDLIQDIKHYLQNSFKGKFDINITGMVALLARTISAATFSLTKSYIIALLAITTMMILFMGDLKIGLLSMVPNLVPIIVIMGTMGFMNIPLDLNSLMIGSIALGILVDDTVHFIYNFKRYYDKSGDPYFAIQKTLLGVGRALLITSLVLSSGFFIFMCSSLKHLFNFGLFTGLTILLAVFADFFLAPALMIIANPNRQVKVQLSRSS
jgi:predicted RND superfamily exporter protein